MIGIINLIFSCWLGQDFGTWSPLEKTENGVHPNLDEFSVCPKICGDACPHNFEWNGANYFLQSLLYVCKYFMGKIFAILFCRYALGRMAKTLVKVGGTIIMKYLQKNMKF